MTRSQPLAALKAWAHGLKRDVVALWIAAGDPRVSWFAKAVAGAVAAYALSPIDLIPDFIPLLGFLDDLVIVPGGIWLCLRLIPPALLAEFRAEADRRVERPTSRLATGMIIMVWIAAAAASIWAYWNWTGDRR